ncbi:hypothetical protein AAVH_09576 [Aphelenchoides avenae]|nr:hypothetical protein AAVH_09576 [Aphelenchus avenae]
MGSGNSCLWIGYMMLSFVELLLIMIQICLWPFGKELPEVPSLNHLAPQAEDDDDSDSDEWADADGEAANSSGARARRSRSLSMSGLPPKNFDNSIFETALKRRQVYVITQSEPEFHDAMETFEWIAPVLELANEHAANVAHV